MGDDTPDGGISEAELRGKHKAVDIAAYYDGIERRRLLNN
jgi:hypothetical protein